MPTPEHGAPEEHQDLLATTDQTDPWQAETCAEMQLYAAQQMRRSMQAEAWTGAGLLGSILSVAAVLNRDTAHSTSWPRLAIPIAEVVALWGVIAYASARAVRTGGRASGRHLS